MRTSKVGKRYAAGLLEFSKETGNTESIFHEMQDIVKIMGASKDLNQFFMSPVLDSKKKIEVAKEIFVNFSPTAQNFIFLIIKQGRISYLKDIAQEYINKVEDLQGVQRISLTSATTLSQDNIDAILKSTDLVNAASKYELQTIINPEILGGYILRVGDQQVDASVRSKLGQLKKEFQLN